MAHTREYERLKAELLNHQEFSMRVVMYSIGLVGGLVGLQPIESLSTTMMGVGLVILSSLLYLIGAARKIFMINAYIALRHEQPDQWHSFVPSLHRRFWCWYESQIIAVIYFLIITALLIFVLISGDLPAPEKTLAVFSYILLAILCLCLYLVPNRASTYADLIAELSERVQD